MTPQHEAERAEAADPATAPERLAALAADHADAVLGNPALGLLLVEQPDWWGGLSARALQNVAFSPRVPVEFAEWVLRTPRVDWRVWHLLWGNARLPVAVRRRALLEGPADRPLTYTALWALRGASVLTLEEVNLLTRGGAASLPQLQHANYQRHGLLASDEVEGLAQLGHLGRWLALHHPSCTPELRARLASR